MIQSKSKLDPVLEEISKRLITYFSPERVYLFGSRTRKDATTNSDYDLLLVMTEIEGPGYQLSQKAQEVLWGISEAVDVFFINRKDFDRKKSVVGSLAEIVHSEGEELYAA